MKKLLAILLSVIMVLSLVACGNKTQDETPSNDDQQQNTETETKTIKVGLICIGDENDQGYTYNFYRAKDSVTEKMAAKAIKYKRSMALEPMNSYERHVIHTALQDYEGVTTSSTGTEPNRRVVVSYEKPQRTSNKPISREWS